VESSTDSLRGKLLVASPALADPNFARTVVLITEHNDEGAMGIVLNRPAETRIMEVLPELADVAPDETIFVGGPVQPDAIVLLAEFSDPDAAAWIVVAELDSWIVEPPLPAELFPDDPDALWSDVLDRKGGQYALIARMPEDPSLN
jgi:putative transcriptional regulator